ncbi:uncharacterized protein LOC143206502 [Rhynchophorus ferrugineus]|uniref:uncharacterized protein LOC143206502 n=1 Tax=Rhynchophorus ferrugineus TaxID=354439 RepID=UPI003FCED613
MSGGKVEDSRFSRISMRGFRIFFPGSVNYPTEFLNSLKLPGLPPHTLKLKVGSLVIMQRNICQPRLCNGTRLKKMRNNVIETTIIKGKYKGEDVLMPQKLSEDSISLAKIWNLRYFYTISKFHFLPNRLSSLIKASDV